MLPRCAARLLLIYFAAATYASVVIDMSDICFARLLLRGIRCQPPMFMMLPAPVCAIQLLLPRRQDGADGYHMSPTSFTPPRRL